VDKDIVSGTVVSISPPETMRIATASGVVRVVFVDHATLWKDAEVSITAFDRREEVVAEGMWTGDAFTASALITLYRPIATHVARVQGHDLLTAEGTVVRFVAQTRRHRGDSLEPVSVSDFQRGDRIVALGRRDVATETFVIIRVYDD